LWCRETSNETTKKGCFPLASIVFLPLGIYGQQPDTQSEFAEDQPNSPPPNLNGRGPSLAFRSEKTVSNYLSGGVDFTGRGGELIGAGTHASAVC
jgi:hypothetical protein